MNVLLSKELVYIITITIYILKYSVYSFIIDKIYDNMKNKYYRSRNICKFTITIILFLEMILLGDIYTYFGM